MYKLTKLAADGTDLHADATGHLAVRLDRGLLAHPITWTAHRTTDCLTWEEAKKWAESLDINGWSWRLPTVEEAFLLPDRSRKTYPFVDLEYFPDCDGEWIWTGTEYAGYAGYVWSVLLSYGSSSLDPQGVPNHVRAVRSASKEGGV
jgi:hypothetical protein